MHPDSKQHLHQQYRDHWYMGELSLLDHGCMAMPRRLRWTLGMQALRMRWLQDLKGQEETRLLGLAPVIAQHRWHRYRLGAATKRNRRGHVMLQAEGSARDGSRVLPVRGVRALSYQSH